MKKVEVVAAVIRKDNKILATQRGYGEFKGGFEFPGGKLESGETKEEALKREIKEELNADIKVEDYICTVEYDYPNFHLTMHTYFCSLLSDKLELVYHDKDTLEHESMKWLSNEELDSVNWLEADIEIVNYLRNNRCLMENINMNKEELLINIDKIHTTEMGIDRIKKNLKIDNDVVKYCKSKILDKNCNIYKKGKNWYCEIDNIKITINSYSYTIITAHMI